MGIQINGNNDTISALDGSWTAEGATTFTGAAGFNGKVSIGGTLTYEDVTNIDAVGIVTARTNVHVGADVAHLGDLDTKITFTDNQIDLRTGGSSRIYASNSGLFIQTGLGLGFLATSGPSPSIKSGGTNHQDLLLTTGNSNPTRIHIKTDGKIGIGTDNPNGQFHIHQSSAGSVTAATDANDLVIESSTNVGLSLLTANDSQARIKFGDPDATNAGAFVYNHQNDKFSIVTGTGNRMIIGADMISARTDYGIARTAGGYTFREVNEGGERAGMHSNASNHLIFKAGGANEYARITHQGKFGVGITDPDELFHIGSTGTAKFKLTDKRTSIADGSQYGVIQFEQKDSNTPGVSLEMAALMTDTTNGATALQIKTGTPSTITERFRISSAGKLTVTSNSEPQVDVQATSAAGASMRVQSAGAYAYHMAVSSNIHWRWGMPTGTSDWVLRESTNGRDRFWVDTGNGAYFKGTSHTNLEIRSNDSSTKALIQTVQGSDIRIGASTNHPLALYAGALEKARLDADGRFHIGSNNNTGTHTKLIVGAGNNLSTTCLINTGDVDTDALTLSNWDGSTTTNKIMMHFDCSGIGGYNIGMPAASDSFVIEDDGGDVHFTVAKHGDVAVANQAPNSYDNPATNVNTVVEANENRSGVYWLNFNGRVFRAYIKANWIQDRNWVLAAKYFDFQDMPSGSSLWTNDTFINESDFNLWGGLFSKYPAWRYFSFNRLAMQMGNRIPPIMGFSSNQTLYGAFSGGMASNGGGVTANQTWPSMSGTDVKYHTMNNFMGPDFYDVGGSEDKMQSYGLNKWANNAVQSTAGQNRGSEDCFAGHRREHTDQNGAGNADHSLQYESLKGWGLTVEDHHPQINGVDSIGRAGAWIGCPLDEGNSQQGSNSSNGGSDSGFGFGWCTGNPGRTGTAGYAEWGNGSQSINTLPAYIWLSID